MGMGENLFPVEMQNDAIHVHMDAKENVVKPSNERFNFSSTHPPILPGTHLTPPHPHTHYATLKR